MVCIFGGVFRQHGPLRGPVARHEPSSPLFSVALFLRLLTVPSVISVRYSYRSAIIGSTRIARRAGT
jgi:hypothetical protein